MKKPNFYIVGAPKCGTTSLSIWLAAHPQIFISPLKEPHFFNTDHNYILTPSLGAYERLFRDATDHHLAVGEASTWYLYSFEAVPNILRYCPEAQFIVCLRNPVDMVHSLHNQQVVNGNEDVQSFEQAWRLQDERQCGRCNPRWCREPRHLIYGDACALGAQMERLLDHLERDRVLPLLLDDVKEKPAREYRKTLEFLGVRDDGRREFPVYNVAQELRSPRLQRAYLVGSALKLRLGIQRNLWVANLVSRINHRPRPRTAPPTALRAELQRFFTPDVERLGALLRRDLSSWVETD